MNNYFLEVLRPGINTTFQDNGRFHMQHLGVTPGGCMDLSLFAIANSLVGNSHNEGVLEFAYQGPLLKLTKGKIKIAVTGSVIFKIIKLDQEVIEGECNRTYSLDEGDQIDILATKQSAYGYMALRGGFNIKSFCKSVSILSRAQIGPNQGKKLKLNDKLKFKISSGDKKNFIINFLNNKSKKIRVLEGPQFDFFHKDSKNDFFFKGV